MTGRLAVAVRRLAVVASILVIATACSAGKSDHAAHLDSTTTSPGAAPSTSAATASTATTTHGHDTMATTTTAFARDRASEKVALDLVDYSFVGMPASVTGPRVFFSATNKGPSDHEIVIVDQDGRTVASVASFAKGVARDLAADLQPGTYTIECLLKQGTKTHAELGMQNTFVVS